MFYHEYEFKECVFPSILDEELKKLEKGFPALCGARSSSILRMEHNPELFPRTWVRTHFPLREEDLAAIDIAMKATKEREARQQEQHDAWVAERKP